jgi:hypothetical protein
MSAARKAIREAIVTSLTSQVTAAGSRVFNSRAVNFWDIVLPAIAVYTRDSSYEKMNSGGDTQLVAVTEVIIEGVVTGTGDTIEGDLDDFIAAIHTAMNAATDFATALEWTLVKVETESSINGEKIIAAAAMTYQVRYIEP